MSMLKGYEIAGTAIMLLITCNHAFVLILGMRRPRLLRRLLEAVQKGVNGIALRTNLEDYSYRWLGCQKCC